MSEWQIHVLRVNMIGICLLGTMGTMGVVVCCWGFIWI